jgi:hypothetical protein
MMSVTEIARRLDGVSGYPGGAARKRVQRELDSGLEKLYRGVRLEVGEDQAAQLLWELFARGDLEDVSPLKCIPRWALDVMRDYPPDLGFDSPLVREPPRPRELPGLMTERRFKKTLRDECHPSRRKSY